MTIRKSTCGGFARFEVWHNGRKLPEGGNNFHSDRQIENSIKGANGMRAEVV